MSEFSNVLNGANAKTVESTPAAPLDELMENEGGKKSYGQIMAEKKAKCYAMIDDACLEVFSSPAKLYEYLMVQSQFEKYSLNNDLLIFAQKPGAGRLKDFNAWKKEGCSVKKGAESIKILEPSPYTGTDGKPHRGYNAKNVFDVEDVNIPPEAQPKERPTYAPKQLMQALIHDAPVPIRKAEQNLGEECAVYDAKDKVIYFKPGLAVEQVFPAIAKALAHAEMANGDENYRTSEHEFKARCAAHALARKYGVDTHAMDIHAIPPKYAALEADDVKRELGDIHTSVKTIAARMTEVLDRPQSREQGQSKSNRNREAR